MSDPLDKPVSIGVELTTTGLNVNAKSRLASAFDRFCGNVVDLGNIPMERRLTRERAKIEGERQLIKAMTRAALNRMESDPQFAERAIRNYLDSAFVRQGNKDEVMKHALEDLRRHPEAEDGAAEIAPAFASKFERYAEDASTEALHEKWGRVLAAEIRKPGTVTNRVLRIVDEINPEIAALFEKICKSRMGNIIPTVLSGDLGPRGTSRLVGAGLLIDPGFTGQVRLMGSGSLGGKQVWIAGFGASRAIAIPSDYALAGEIFDSRTNVPLRKENDIPVIPVLALTDEGVTLSKILPDMEVQAVDRFVDELRLAHPTMPILVLKVEGAGQFRVIQDVPPASR